MSITLSHSKARMLLECGKKYDLHYNKRIRSRKIFSFFPFGSSIDSAFNLLLGGSAVDKAVDEFVKCWTNYTNVSGESVYLPTSLDVEYSSSDFDASLFKPEEITVDMSSDEFVTQEIFAEKQKLYWESLKRKGEILIASYAKHVMPRFKQVLAIQETVKSENEVGDTLFGILDFVVEMQNGKRYLMDNKTSSVMYDKESTLRSQQLIMYYALAKEKYNLDGVGFVVIPKRINHNKKKKCSICGHTGDGSRAKTCDAEVDGKRCGGEWIVETFPEVEPYIIVSEVSQNSMDMVFEIFNNSTIRIKNELFDANFASCIMHNKKCPYYDYCHKGELTNVVSLP